jgi:hypothetical protein
MRQCGTANSSIINSPEGAGNTEYLINALRPAVEIADAERDGHSRKYIVSKGSESAEAISKEGFTPFSTYFRRAISTIPLEISTPVRDQPLRASAIVKSPVPQATSKIAADLPS